MRVLLVEDDETISSAVIAHFTRCGVKIDWLDRCEDITAEDIEEPFDVLILDLGLPGRGGISLLKDLRKAGAEIPILIFTAQYEIDARVNALNLGADDYLTKPFDMRELFARCQALSRRRGVAKPVVLQYRDLEIDSASRTVTFHGVPVNLTPKVLGLLSHLVENQGRLMTREHLEEHLYGWDSEAESNTLEVFVSKIRRTLEADYVRTIRGLGYMVPMVK
ncbi:MAG: response regulator transcription factor [Cognatishimia sp.]